MNFPGGGASRIDIPAASGGGSFYLGNGDDTVNAIGGNSFIATGKGNNLIVVGIGSDTITSTGTDTIMAGPGSVTLTLGDGARDVVLLGGGTNFVDAANAVRVSATVVGSAGSDTVTGQVLFFAGSGISHFIGAGTVVGGSGTTDVFGGEASFFTTNVQDLVFGGTGLTSATLPGAATVVGNAAGRLNLVQTGGAELVFAEGITRITVTGGSQTVLGVSGGLTVSGGAGLYLATPDGNSHITAGGNATIFGAAAGDILASSATFTTAQVVIVGGAGAETITGAGSTSTNIFFAGSGPEFIQAGDWLTSIVTSAAAATIAGGVGISLTAFVNGQHPDVVMQNFNPARDYVTFINFGTGEVAAALAGAQTVAGSELLTLSDGTHITFQGFTGLQAANIL
ncbi:MAG: hypothetical protein NT133_24915 [Alphaproteobacteria bacterium]|nr:hypothetical protein [Alphaproteobacteria bacterium]